MEKIVIGLDLAGNPKNPTGFCVLHNSIGKVKILKTDEEILERIFETNPEVVAIDSPLSLEDRICDRLLKKYGVMPVKLKSIYNLGTRAIHLVEKILTKIDTKIIEVFPTGTAKILGVYSKNYKEKQNLIKDKLSIRFKEDLTKDELDSVLCALTGLLYMSNLTQDLGDEKGKITIPLEKNTETTIIKIQSMNIFVEKWV